MRILAAYASRHGATRGIEERVAQERCNLLVQRAAMSHLLQLQYAGWRLTHRWR